MSEVMCPICGYETMVWENPLPACPDCDRSAKCRIDRKLLNSGVDWTDDGPRMEPTEEAEKRQEVYRMLGVIDTDV